MLDTDLASLYLINKYGGDPDGILLGVNIPEYTDEDDVVHPAIRYDIILREQGKKNG